MDMPKKDGDTTPQADAEPSRDAKQSADTNEGSDSNDGADPNDGAKRKSVDEQLSDLDEKIDQTERTSATESSLGSALATANGKRGARSSSGPLMLTLAGESEKCREFLRKNLDHSIKSERDRELFADLLTKKSQK